MKPFYKIIKNSYKIKELYLDHNNLNGKNVILLKDILLLNKYLVTLSLSNCRLDDGVKDLILEYIPQNMNIENLNLEGNNFSFSDSKVIDSHLSTVKKSKEQNINISDSIVVNKIKVN